MDNKELERKIDEKLHGTETSTCYTGGGIGEHANWYDHHNEKEKEDNE